MANSPLLIHSSPRRVAPFKSLIASAFWEKVAAVAQGTPAFGE
jgi:hypothetical protein